MPRTRLFNLATVGSSLGFCILFIAWTATDGFNSWTHFITLWPGFHLTLVNRDHAAHLAFFNDQRVGPFFGGTVGNASIQSPRSIQVRDTHFDAIGFYFRFVRWPGGLKIWTLSVSLRYPLVLCTILPVIWIDRQRRQPRASRRQGFPVQPISDS